MADKKIFELVAAEKITASDMFVLEQNGTAKKLTGQVLLNWLTAAADGHGGIQSYTLQKTEGLVKTYRFTLADKSYMDIQIIDGRGIRSVEKVDTIDLVDIYQINGIHFLDGSDAASVDYLDIHITLVCQSKSVGFHQTFRFLQGIALDTAMAIRCGGQPIQQYLSSQFFCSAVLFQNEHVGGCNFLRGYQFKYFLISHY